MKSYNYEEDFILKSQAISLIGKTIIGSYIKERNSMAVVILVFDDNTIAEIGVSGNLHDEAYLVFELNQ